MFAIVKYGKSIDGLESHFSRKDSYEFVVYHYGYFNEKVGLVQLCKKLYLATSSGKSGKWEKAFTLVRRLLTPWPG